VVLILFIISSCLCFSGMAFGFSCFTSKVQCDNAFWTSDILDFSVYMVSPKTCLDGEY
jgi:hypothetical protein